MSGRDLEVNFDYDRKFILIGSRVGELIDEGLTYLRNGYKEIEGHKTRTFEEWAAQTGKPTTGWGVMHLCKNMIGYSLETVLKHI